MDLELTGKRAVITGGSRGIGRAIALALAAEGCAVAIGARDLQGVHEAVAELRERGGAAYGEAVDVTDADALEAFVISSADALGGLDLLVANAGALRGGPRISAIDASDWRYTFDINVTHPAIAARVAAPLIARNGGGAMVFISSIAGMHRGRDPTTGPRRRQKVTSRDRSRASWPLWGSASTRSARARSSSRGRRGRVRLPTATRLTAGSSTSCRSSGWEPTPRLANVACFLLSDRASWVTGVNLPVDGGQSPPNMMTTQPMPGRWRDS